MSRSKHPGPLTRLLEDLGEDEGNVAAPVQRKAYAVGMTVSIPMSLAASLNDAIEARGVSRNRAVVEAIEAWIEKGRGTSKRVSAKP